MLLSLFILCDKGNNIFLNVYPVRWFHGHCPKTMLDITVLMYGRKFKKT